MALPVSVGLTLRVMASLLLRPVSVAWVKAAKTGASGTTVLSSKSRVTRVSLPAASVAVICTCFMPSAPRSVRVPSSTGMRQRPEASATVCKVLTTVPPTLLSSSTRSVRLASARPPSVMPAAFSVALTTSSSATAAMPTDGPWVSISRLKSGLAVLVLPATSVAMALRVWVPSLKALPSVSCHRPAALATVVPSTVLPERRLTVAPASAVPLNVGWLLWVRLSLLLVPVSGLKPLMRGANGAVLSTVTFRLAPALLVLPATSTRRALRLVLPAGKAVVGVRVTLAAVIMLSVSTTLATWVLPANRRSSSPATALVPASATLKLGLAIRVMLSVLLMPVSSAATKSGVTVPGATLSITRVRAGELGLKVLPSRTARATRL